MSPSQVVAPATGTEFAAVVNPLAGPVPGVEVPTAEILAFHRRLPGYEPTPLLSLPALAERLEIGSLLVKVESSRFGLPAFKMLGASWAVYKTLRERLGSDLEPWHDVDELAQRLSALRPFTLVAATDGNHGRAVARMARLVGLGARVFVPSGTTDARIAGIAAEGAEVTVVPGNYDAAVARSAEDEGPRSAVISDTSWPGYRDVPRWVSEGYSTMFTEIDDALGAAGRRQPDTVVVPIGVGALAAAAVEHGQRHGGRGALVGVEPTDAACATASALAGELVTLEGEQHSIMVGLNCGTPSPIAWPLISRGMAGFLTIGDEWARRAVRELAAVGVEAGETGAAALGGLDALRDRGGPEALERLFGPTADVLVLVTEGASDLAAWRRILGVEVVGAPVPGAPGPEAP
ncbi:MAG: diaminopropionate ammonia-lyase [Actinomycetota bacterium]|nr:diaminopropionate ammonia-lyase [Actinomycetota bacterium]MDA8315350.1 diaminopropionate ammonia-lyase [Actinomycetota bacterium]